MVQHRHAALRRPWQRYGRVPLFLLSEDRPFAQQKARVGLGAFALLCVVALMDVGLPFWGLCVLGLVLWFSLPGWFSRP